MKHSVLSALIFRLCFFMLAVIAVPIKAMAKEEELPHLIQTVTERDIYESMLALGLLETQTLMSDDCDKAYENVRSCVVRIDMGNAHGSGVIWEMTPECLVIVTNKHVLEYWDELISYIRFPQGYLTDAQLMGTSDKYDVGFLTVDKKEFDYRELEKLRYVSKDMNAYKQVKAGDEMFCMGAENSAHIGDEVQSAGDESFYRGSVGDMWKYIDEFEEYMIYGIGYARPGMSGGGTFDAKGNFIGIISGGTADGETASVPLPIIMKVYEELQQ